MKYKYNGEWLDINIKALDSMPVGTIVDYDGNVSDIPSGWEQTMYPVLAYDGNSSTEITLNTSTTNYNFIEIIYTGADGSYSSSGRIPIIQNMTISLINHSFRDNEGTIIFWVSTVLLAGNKLTPQTSKWAWYTNGAGYGISQGNYVNIRKVYLYK